ncbi:glycoside hydrolase family 31 protein [Microbacter margulisiae]|uniref:Alpha-D-xyloside xylohydrolase n=1 Tax=Microbacter margulisiae TaxID=1350067 RepID=A0A7W5H0Z6_9PORP|nr:TIM-barrel domain-containing protein [Microbacter margulisiae]MBB3186200.1 alpha-D-xyloside xylohydrolase [Microbacter margulisiae]
MKIKLLLILSLYINIAICNADSRYIMKENQLIIPQKTGTLILTVFSSKIIRVTFSRKDSILTKMELAVVKVPEKTSWNVITGKSDIILNTIDIKAIIDTAGTIQFFNKEGKLLLSELPGGRKLTPTTVLGEKSFSPEQGFICGDEALYGMGQFQDGLMNWKNVPLRLKQYNQEIMVPFLVSTKGYGLLWDNYSVTKFNPAEKEMFFTNIIDSTKNERRTTFIPSKTGIYCFAVESINPKENRFSGPVLLTINGDTVIHYNTPWVPDFFSGKKELIAGKTYNVVFENANTKILGKVLYNEPDYNKTIFRSQLGNMIDYYFVYGPDIASVISNYRDLTGQAPLFGKWAYGFWQCRERYHSQTELLENAMEYRKLKIPVDNIVQDWNYWPEKTWGPEWNRKLYPDPQTMCQKLKGLNFHLMVSVWPCLRNHKLEEKYNLGAQYKYDTVNGNLDFYNKEVRKNFYKMVKDSMFSVGVNSIWLDGTEPEVYPLNATTAIGPYDNYALTYSLPVTRSIYEGFRKDFPNQRVFSLTRSAFVGQQRYAAACWSGDIKGTWEQFAEQISAGMNYAMAGLPYWTTDIGGFFRDSTSLNPKYDNQYTNIEYKELLTRWFEFGTFCPIFRIHGYKSNTEVWRYGTTFENIARKFIDLRYQLMPYIYSLAWQVTSQGAIIMKPLVHDYPQDKNTWNIKHQFLFGSSILVSPIIKYKARGRNLYLPAGSWINFWTGEKVCGGRNVNVLAPLNQIPLFIKSGSIIPVGPKVQYAMQPYSSPLKILVYPGADASFILYEDEGDTYNYEKGDYSTIKINWDDKTKTLTFGARDGKFNGMLLNRSFDIYLMGQNNKKLGQGQGILIPYDGKKKIIHLKK